MVWEDPGKKGACRGALLGSQDRAEATPKALGKDAAGLCSFLGSGS